MSPTNEFDQPVGADLGDWESPEFPPAKRLDGRTVVLEPLEPQNHGPSLFEELGDASESLWTYMAFGPFPRYAEFEATLQGMCEYPDWSPYAIVVDRRPLGFASYLRIQPSDGVIEIGSITFAPALQRTTAATEAIYLMIRFVFELGYRRCEWKCDDLNEPSRIAAVRLGFTYEGTFRQATHYKQRNRDTAWYAITDEEWPSLDQAFEKWLAPNNFGPDGVQMQTLRQIREGT